jgi:hypothetical protein
MCLYVDLSKTKKELEKSENIWTFWKLYIKYKDRLETPYFSFVIKKFGIYKIENPIALKDVNANMVGNRAFHARLCEESLKQDLFYADFFKCGEVCINVPIKVKKKDIIAFGMMDNVCFRAYEILKETWDSIFK